MLNYEPKILVAFGEAVSGNNKIFHWLAENGYIELASLANCINSDNAAFFWLLKNGYPHLAILSNAMDGYEDATNGLKNTK